MAHRHTGAGALVRIGLGDGEEEGEECWCLVVLTVSPLTSHCTE